MDALKALAGNLEPVTPPSRNSLGTKRVVNTQHKKIRLRGTKEISLLTEKIAPILSGTGARALTRVANKTKRIVKG